MAPHPKVHALTRRLCRVTLAVGVTVGAVLLARWCIRTIVLSAPAGRHATAPAVPPVARAEKSFDLAHLVPRDLEVSVMGVPAEIAERRLPMPIELAEKACAAEAEAKGWTLKEELDSVTIFARMLGQRVYERPDKGIVLQRLTPDRGGATNVRELALPLGEMSAGANENVTVDELQLLHGSQMRRALPFPLRSVVVGSPVFTQLMRRNGGCAFIVGTVGPLPVPAAERELEKALQANGWTRQENLSRAYAYANLSLLAEVRERTGALGYEIVYRFSDDEVYFTQKGTNENEN